MKKGIHPKYTNTVYSCGCGATHEIRSVMGDAVTVEACSSCHPVYTGKEKNIDAEGRIDRFKKKYAKK